jgi:hypothetical protein
MAIVRHNSEIIANFEPKFNIEYRLSSLYTRDRILLNKVLISSEKHFER